MTMRCELCAATLAALIVAGGCSQSAAPESAAFARRTSVDRRCDLGRGWSFRTPGRFAQRIEDGNLLFWCEGLTVYAIVWDNNANESAADRLAWIQQRVSPEGFEREQSDDDGLLRFSYRLTEHRKEGVLHALYGYAIGPDGHVQMAVYCDREEELATARAIWRSVARQGGPTRLAELRGSPTSLSR
jgi:hypothetical protein